MNYTKFTEEDCRIHTSTQKGKEALLYRMPVNVERMLELGGKQKHCS